jgi:hypothetical protein
MKRARTQLSINFENFKISSLLTEIWQFKLLAKILKITKTYFTKMAITWPKYV